MGRRVEELAGGVFVLCVVWSIGVYRYSGDDGGARIPGLS